MARKKNPAVAVQNESSNVAVLDCPPPAVAEAPPAESPVVEKHPTPSQPAARPVAEWDRVQHSFDWFAVFLLIGCVATVWSFNVVDTILILLGR